MNTTATGNVTAAAGTILALDLGRYNSVACRYHRSTAEYTFPTLDTSYANLRCLLRLASQA